MKEAGPRQHRIRKREEILFELLNSSLAQLGPERSDAHRDSFEANGVLCTKTGQIRQATALYYTIPALGKYNITSHWRRVSMPHHFANTKSWRHLLLGTSLLPNCTDFLSATLFEMLPILRAMEAIDSQDFSRKW